MKQKIKSQEEIEFDNLMSYDKEELVESLIDTKETIKDLNFSVNMWREKWVDAVDEMNAYKTLLKLAKKEIKQLKDEQ